MPDQPSHTDVVFFGSGAFGLPTLEALHRTHRVVGVVTQPDRPAGRGKKLTPNPIAAWAQAHLPGVPIVKEPRVDDPGVCAQIRAFPATTWVVIAFGQKLGPALLADRFAINLHASLLPRWRGAAPINHAILAGDTVTGNSVITLAQKMDAGHVLGQNSTPIGHAETAGELHDRLSAMGPELVLGVIARHAAGTLEPEEQDESLVTLAGKLSREDAAIDFTRLADEIRCQINGLSPWPGCAVEIGGVRVKLLRADSQQAEEEEAEAGVKPPDSPGTPGTLTDPATGTVQTGAGSLRLIDVQPAGKPAMGWADFVRGHQPEPGTEIRRV
ncbi:MAG: methionyl-tRNA formyltransferase [Phycisphaerales bacterium]|jgi:methionyl-tRNA formyltransferase